MIENSDVYFKIEGCNLYNTGKEWDNSGIRLSNANNGQLIMNKISNYFMGISLDTSDNNSIVGNICDSNVPGCTGIKLISSNNNSIYFNSLINNFVTYGFWFSSDNDWNSMKKLTYIYKGSTYMNYLGNYFENYNGQDTNNDGIGESPLYYDTQGGTIILILSSYPLIAPIENYHYEFKSSDVIKARIIITNPIKLSELVAGQQHTITWTSMGPIRDVLIQLYKGNEVIETITSSTENDGSYEWTVGYYETSPMYRIYIQDVNNEIVNTYSEYFEISAVIPGYDLFLLIGVICIISLILLEKRKKLLK